MPVSHARATALASTDEKVPGLLGVLAPGQGSASDAGPAVQPGVRAGIGGDLRAGRAGSFREIRDQASDLPQELLAALGGLLHPLRCRIVTPSEKRIRTLLQVLDAEVLDQVIGDWLRALAAAGRLEGLLTAIAIDGEWLRSVADGQVKLFAAMLHEEKVIIAQHRIPDDTSEITQVEELLDPVDLTDAVVTADAAQAQHDTAEYIGGKRIGRKREPDYLLGPDCPRRDQFIPQVGEQRAVDVGEDVGLPSCRTASYTPARSARDRRSNMRPGADQLRCNGSSTTARACATSSRGKWSGTHVGLPRGDGCWVNETCGCAASSHSASERSRRTGAHGPEVP
jgi:hypothetical protein